MPTGNACPRCGHPLDQAAAVNAPGPAVNADGFTAAQQAAIDYQAGRRDAAIAARNAELATAYRRPGAGGMR